MSWQTNSPTLFHHVANSQKKSDFAPIHYLLTAALTATEERLMFPRLFPYTSRSERIWCTHFYCTVKLTSISHVGIFIIVILLRLRQQDSTPASTQIHWSTSLPLCCGAGFSWVIVPQQQHGVCLATAGERFSPSRLRLSPGYWQSGPTLTARLLYRVKQASTRQHRTQYTQPLSIKWQQVSNWRRWECKKIWRRQIRQRQNCLGHILNTSASASKLVFLHSNRSGFLLYMGQTENP